MGILRLGGHGGLSGHGVMHLGAGGGIESGGGAEFSPDSIPNPMLIYSADLSIFKDAAKTQPAVADGDAIWTFGDQSLNSRDAVRTLNSSQAVLKANISNGKPSILINPAINNQYLVSNGSSLNFQAPFVIAGVMRSDDLSAAKNVLIKSGNIALSQYSGPFCLVLGRYGIENIVTPFSWSSGSLRVFVLRFGSDFSVSVWDSSVYDGTVLAGGNMPTSANVMNFLGTTVWDGYISYFGAWQSELSDANCAALGRYLTEYWLGESATWESIINASSPLTTPTYDGSGQIVHPDIFYSESGWNGHKYWMVMTPYTNSSSNVENPSILTSEDGEIWSVPAGLTNPIVSKPVVGYNSDPSLCMSSDGTTLWMVYRETNGTNADYIKVRSSTDGVTWSAETQILTGGYASLISPVLRHDGTQFVIWYRASTGIKKITCETVTGTWSDPSDCTLDLLPYGRNVWHQNVVRYGSGWLIAAVSTTLNTIVNPRLFFATSDNDGISWTLLKKRLTVSPSGFDKSGIYQSALVPTDGGYHLYYTANNSSVWRMGKTTLTL